MSYKPSACPKCGSANTRIIVYYIPDPQEEKADETVYYWKGDIKFCDCQWHCIDCHWEWERSSKGHYDPPEVEGDDEEEDSTPTGGAAKKTQ